MYSDDEVNISQKVTISVINDPVFQMFLNLGSAWNSAPGATSDFTIQLSGIMLFEAMAELKKLKLVS